MEMAMPCFQPGSSLVLFSHIPQPSHGFFLPCAFCRCLSSFRSIIRDEQYKDQRQFWWLRFSHTVSWGDPGPKAKNSYQDIRGTFSFQPFQLKPVPLGMSALYSGAQFTRGIPSTTTLSQANYLISLPTPAPCPMSCNANNMEMNLRSWHLFNFEAKWTMLIPKF